MLHRNPLRWRGLARGLAGVGTVIAAVIAAVIFAALPEFARAAEHITLSNGFEIDCTRREPVGDNRVRIFLLPSSGASLTEQASYIDVAANAVVRVEAIPDLPPAIQPQIEPKIEPKTEQKIGARREASSAKPTAGDLHAILAHAGSQHHIDEDLLASVVKAESGGNVFAVSRTGARGLMQLMPGTASAMGVDDAFRPEQNIAGGTAYLDQLLVRYHDDAALALAAYNAGPGAVDKYHGIPPFRETRAYVARVIGEFNRRKQQAALIAKSQLAVALVSATP